PAAPGDVSFELYRSGVLVATSSPLDDQAPERTFLPSGYTGLIDEIRVRSLGASMTPIGGAWVMDNMIFGRAQTKTLPAITWPPSPITSGTAPPPPGTDPLNAVANVPGTFTYSPSTGIVLAAGPQPLSAPFVPYDTLHYQNATGHAVLTVLKAT